MFLPESADGSPLTTADAATRAAMEPLVEIYQHKGSSECRPGLDSTDEPCGFELMQINVLQGIRNPNQTFGGLAFVRNALKEGLLQEQRVGANPFRLGFIGSTDTHNGSPGATLPLGINRARRHPPSRVRYRPRDQRFHGGPRVGTR